MTEEPDKKEPVVLEKLAIDNLSDFQFHAAYVTYSDVFDKTTDVDSKKRLNESISALQQKQIDYATFYRNISQYRGEEGSRYHYGKAYISTQRKKDWHREAQKQERIKRHKK